MAEIVFIILWIGSGVLFEYVNLLDWIIGAFFWGFIYLMYSINTPSTDKLPSKPVNVHEPNQKNKEITNQYINGKKHGKWTETTFGSLFEINYIDGVQNGKMIGHFFDGAKMSEEDYLNGKKNGTSTFWDEDGNISVEENYTDDIINGVSRTWYTNGNISEEDNYTDGQLNGKKTMWHENGQKKLEEYYVNNTLQKGAHYWDEDGNKCPKDDLELDEYNDDDTPPW